MALKLPFKKFYVGLFKSSAAVDEGISEKKDKVYDYSIHGIRFRPVNASDIIVSGAYVVDYGVEVGDQSFIKALAPVELPHGATIISAIVEGGDASDTWALKRTNKFTQSSETIASGAFADDAGDPIVTSIAKGKQILNNRDWVYFFETGAIEDHIAGARIEYVF